MIETSSKLTYEGKPIEVLHQLIEKRKKLLGQCTHDAVVATAITVLKSLRAGTKIAPKTARKGSYKITDTGWYGGWERTGATFHRVVRTSNATRAQKIHNIYPVNLAGQHYVKGEIVKVYKVEPVNDPNMKWDKTKHVGCWYVFAKSQDVVESFAQTHMTRRISTYRGLAKTTLGFAMAAIANNGNFGADAKTAKALRAAKSAAQVVQDGNVESGEYTITITDMLNYAALALKEGKNGIVTAMKKAANSIVGRLNKIASAKLTEPISTPFPEVRGS